METQLTKNATINEVIAGLQADHSVVIHGFGRFDLVIKKGVGNFPNCKGEYVTKKITFLPTRWLRDLFNGRKWK